MRKIYSLIFVLTLSVSRLLAQSGTLQGKITDADTKEGISFSTVVILRNGTQVQGVVADIDGNYVIKPIDPGKYVLKVSYVGYATVTIEGLEINADKISEQNVQLGSSSKTLNTVVISTTKLVDPDHTEEQTTLTHDQIQGLAVNRTNTTDMTTLTNGVFQADRGQDINVSGSRGYSTVYYVDGIQMTGTINLPSNAIEQLQTITGGVPARYGNSTGGVVNITTRGPSKDFTGQFELGNSYLIDVDHYRLASLFLSGPIFTKNKKSKGTSHDSSDAKIGFVLNAEYEGNDGGRSPAGTWYTVKPGKLDTLQQFPLTRAPFGAGFIPSADYITNSDLEQIKALPNNNDNNFRFQGKVDYKLNNYITLTAGGNSETIINSGIGSGQVIFDPTVESYANAGTYRGYARYQQRFATDNSSVFQNAFYQIQVDYTKFYETTEDKSKGFNPFLYGYVGKFNTLREPFYVQGSDTLTDGKGNYLRDKNGNLEILSGQVLAGYRDTLVTFQPGTENPLISNYTKQYYNLSGSTPVNGVYGLENVDGLSYAGAQAGGLVGNQVNHYSSLVSEIENQGGIINGELPQPVYSMWNDVGAPVGGYGITNNNQYHLSFYGSVDVVKPTADKNKDKERHALEFGVEYTQHINRSYSVSPFSGVGGLWGLARNLANEHIQTLDTKNPIPVYDKNGVYQDTLNYNRLVGSDQAFFDKNLRQRLGLPVNGTDYINVDNLDPSVLSLNLFDPDELFNNGNALVSYYGYDYLGNVMTKQPSFSDFFTEKDANGNYVRPVGAFEPNYSDAYLEDKFSFKDLIFNIGVRVDRYDANEQVLKDPYSLYPIRTVADVKEVGGQPFTPPSTIGSGYAVYVDNLQNPTRVVGYRNGNVWYDQNGTEIQDPSVIAAATSTGKITPYLVNNNSDSLQVNGDAFTSYTPQFTFEPRIAFSFPISDEALFFAHYDVYAQNPTQNQVSPYDYYFLPQNSVDVTLNNPALTPEKTIDYEVGFKQALGLTSALSISAKYRELKDLVQIQKYFYAFPVDYTTYGNSDFGTVKSLEVTYELLKTKNIYFMANYALQFADGTGDATSSSAGLLNLSQSGETIKPVFPFGYDSRHHITTDFNYSYDEGKFYNGPVVGKNKVPIFANTGVDIIFSAWSGTPYSRQLLPTPTQLGGVSTSSPSTGTINGSRLPWSYRFDLKINKNFKVGKASAKRYQYYINAYVTVLNVLNTMNILHVYAYTGNPNDDGYLSSPIGQQAIQGYASVRSFQDLYTIAVNNPGNYSLPRSIRCGLSFKF